MPLALVVIRQGQVLVDGCLVRPRVYSNARLLELILCLADKIDACCGQPAAAPLQVVSIAFLARDPQTGGEVNVASIASPLQDTAVDIAGRTNAIRLRFNKPLASDDRAPTTHGAGDADFQSHNVQVLPAFTQGALPYVPGTLTVEAPDTLRFDLLGDSPYSRGADGWQKGRYRIFLRGTDDAANRRPALADTGDATLDGEAIAPAGGVISGDGQPGGDFSAFFTVGGVASPPAPEPPPPAPPAPTPPAPERPMHVARVEFLGAVREGQPPTIGVVKSPLSKVELQQSPGAIRIAFDRPFASSGPNAPNAAGLGAADFQAHNLVVRVGGDIGTKVGGFLAGTLVIEDARTLRLDVARGTALVDAAGQWRRGLTVNCELLLRGAADPAHQAPALEDGGGRDLDGEPIAPAGGVISGDGNPGGDFKLVFVVSV